MSILNYFRSHSLIPRRRLSYGAHMRWESTSRGGRAAAIMAAGVIGSVVTFTSSAAASTFTCDAGDIGRPDVDLPVTIAAPATASAGNKVSVAWTIALNGSVSNIADLQGEISSITVTLKNPGGATFSTEGSSVSGLQDVQVSGDANGLSLSSSTTARFTKDEHLPVLSIVRAATISSTASFDPRLLTVKVVGKTGGSSPVAIDMTCTSKATDPGKVIVVGNSTTPQSTTTVATATTTTKPTTTTAVAPVTTVVVKPTPPQQMPRTGSSLLVVLACGLGLGLLRLALSLTRRNSFR